MTGYVKVAHVDELVDGEGRTVEAGGRWIALFRTDEGVAAIDNACPHMAGPLGAGRLDGFVVTCPLHGWQIDVRTGRSPTNEYVRVGCYDVRVDEGDVWVRVS